MNLKTKVISLAFRKRQKELEKHNSQAKEMQMKQLQLLIQKGQQTLWGKTYGYDQIKSYEHYTQRVPLQDYEGFKPYIQRMLQGETNILWPSSIKWFAKSSGTTNDKSKYIPVSKDALNHCHYQGGFDSVAIYLKNNPNSALFNGKALILGGSHKPTQLNKQSYCGDLSAVLIQNITPIMEFVRVPKKHIALMDEWEEKLEKMVEATMNENITNLSGVPSWFMVFLQKIMARKGVNNLHDVWPNLEVFFHGGISFDPYREQYKSILPSENMKYVEVYNASEGFFGIQNDPQDHAMLLLLDVGVFYEFIPMSEFGKPDAKAIPIWETEPNINYALVITTNSGLWRYIIGDTIMFSQTHPYKFTITGRTKHYINAFGEELMVSNAEKGIAKACEKTGAKVQNYTAAPTYMSDEKRGHHTWMIEFTKKPNSVEDFAICLDQELQQLNSDYEAKRYKDIFLDPLKIIEAKEGLFHNWLKEKGKLGGQHKIPRLSNSRNYLEELIKMNELF